MLDHTLDDHRAVSILGSEARDVRQSLSRDVRQSLPRDVRQSLSGDVRQSLPRDVRQSLPRDVRQSLPRDVRQSAERAAAHELPEAQRKSSFDDVLRALSRAPSVRPVDIDLVGRTVGRFVVERRLGEGGMGIVYEACDPVLGRKVALKVLRASHRGSAATRARLHEEARRVAALHHPHIATVYDAGEHDGIVFLALERAAGRSLRARLAAPPALALPRALAILRAIAAGLACAHEAGIIHRDLKPENVVVGDDGTVKIIDFGIATASGEGGAPSRNARPAGTKRYMAPEHAAGAPATARADVYAFGVLAREVLAATFVPVRARSSRSALQRLIQTCTAPDPHDRPADGAALLAAVDAILNPPRALSRATAAASLGSAAVAALVGLAVARSAPAPAAASSTTSAPSAPAAPHAHAAPAGARASAPAARPRSPNADSVAHAAPRPLADVPGLDRAPVDELAPASPAPGADRSASHILLGAQTAPLRLAAHTPADAAHAPALPVTAVLDDRGRLVATVRLDGYRPDTPLTTATLPALGTGTARGPLTALPPMTALATETAEAEVLSDGEGGAVIHLKVRVLPPIAGGSSTDTFDSETGNSDGGDGDKPNPWNAKAKAKAKPRPASVAITNGAQPDTKGTLWTPMGKPAMPGERLLPLCADAAPENIRILLAPDGAFFFVAELDGQDTVLAAVDGEGGLRDIGEAAHVCKDGQQFDSSIHG